MQKPAQGDGIMLSPPFRVMFPNLFEAKPVKKNGRDVGEPIYGAMLIIDPDYAPTNDDDIQSTFDDVRRLAGKIAKTAFGTTEGVRYPWKKGEVEKAKAEKKGKDGDMYDGMVTLKVKSKYQPGVVDERHQEVIDPKKIYSGSYGCAEINLVPNEVEDEDGPKRYITAYINHYMKLGDGDRLTGRTAADAFANVRSRVSDDDVGVPGLDDLDDEIPF